MAWLQGEAELQAFLEGWPTEQMELKQAYEQLLASALALPGVALSFIARPGISHSLRLDLEAKPAGRTRPLFFMADAVDSTGARFISVCFYGDEITDPEEMGDEVPQGLFQETGYCFDLEDDNAAEMGAYLCARQQEAHQAASRS